MWNEPLEPFIAFGIPIGFLMCWTGLRFSRLWIAALGCIAGGLPAAAWAQAANASEIVVWAAAGLGSVAGALFFGFFSRVGVFLIGAAAGALVAAHLAAPAGDGVFRISAILSALVGGFLALRVGRIALLLAMSLVGAWLTVSGILHFTLGLDPIGEIGAWPSLPGGRGWVALTGAGLLAISGAIFQLRSRSA